ncbi:dipeptide/oligopeptide/nickel ABC transporter permease/ATP-binding protein [Nakamurella lactea]|uniref:dipeptide/oligopeptide/nickel ABC transporter permease/ATP-binding protein n=1 Tax=Nakamurella lactea TaxID=459515 RepID=UPI0003FFD86B|nr:dipeptide/oligopeptide/nickel ABC transporter permease/ATP-binding protein [Nakamurella lactea]
MSTTDIAEKMVDRAAARAGTGRGGLLRRLATSPLGMAALLVDLLLLLLVVFGPMIWGAAAEEFDVDNMNSPPTDGHLFGTDSLGRDILLRVLVATRLSIGLALGATAIGAVIGLLLGAIPAVAGPRVGRAVVAVVNVAVAFPGLLLALFFASIFGASPSGAMLALGVAFAPGFARLTQTLTAGVVGRDYVSAARVIGVGRLRIIGRHLLPNVADTLVVNISLSAGGALLAFAGLSFLGLGVQAPSYDWGRMLFDGLDGIYVNPAAALAPGLAIVLAGLALNLTGEVGAQLVGRRVGSARLPAKPATGAATSVADGPDGSPGADDLVLDLRGLTVSFPRGRGEKSVPVRGVDLRIARGEAVGILGESGSGKSLTAMSVARLVPDPARVDVQSLTFEGRDLSANTSRELRRMLGTTMSVVFQDLMSSFNPVMKVGRQLAEVATEHQGIGRRAALDRAIGRLRSVSISRAEQRALQYPHELSGGMRQRAMIAMGLMGSPTLLIADEPTTALDATVQRRVLQLIAGVRAAEQSALLLISHDVAVVAAMCDRILVMYAGRVVEDIPVDDLLAGPRHPYSRALLAAVPTIQTDRSQSLRTIEGRPPQPADYPIGCAFAERCAFASEKCQQDPVLEPIDNGSVACWHPQQGPVPGVVIDSPAVVSRQRATTATAGPVMPSHEPSRTRERGR